MTQNIERYKYDIVVIGAGGAGLRAAVEAREAGLTVAIVCKSLFGKAHTVMAEGGAAASMGNVNEKDNWMVHFRDTMRGGKFLNHYRMAELHAKEAPDRIWELETWGALFDRTKEGKISQRNFGGHEYPRLAHVGDRTGLELIRTMQQRIVALQQIDARETGNPETNIRVFAEVTITEILKENGKVAGAYGYRRENGVEVLFEAPAVVIATGGVGKTFKITSNSWEGTGDGHGERARHWGLPCAVQSPGDWAPLPRAGGRPRPHSSVRGRYLLGGGGWTLTLGPSAEGCARGSRLGRPTTLRELQQSCAG